MWVKVCDKKKTQERTSFPKIGLTPFVISLILRLNSPAGGGGETFQGWRRV